MTGLIVLDPTSPPPEDSHGPGPDAGSLAGRTVGIRYDKTWRSFEWVIDEWIPQLEAMGADVRLWSAGNRIGDAGERTFRELAEWVDAVDVAVAGLGN